MKIKVLILSILISGIWIVACDKVDQLLTFDVKDSGLFTIPSTTGINLPVNIPVPTITSTASKTFENNNTKASLVKNVTLKKLELQIVKPGDRTFQFLKSIKIYISAEGAPEILLAELNNIPSTVGSNLELTSAGNPLDPYITKSTYNLKSVVEVREIPGSDIQVKADMVFQVTAKTY